MSKKIPKISKKELVQVLSEKNYPTAAIAKSLDCSSAYVSDAKRAILKRKCDLTSEKIVKSAFTGIKHILKGETFGTIKEVKATDFINAFREVFDRVNPKIQQNVNINLDFSPIDLTKYEN